MPRDDVSQKWALFFPSLLIPCYGLFVRGHYLLAFHTLLLGGVGILVTGLVSHLVNLGAGVFSGMLLFLPWWTFQAYQSSLSRPVSLGETWSLIWGQAHDIRFIGLLFGIAAFTDIWIIFNNPDYRLHVFCTRPTGWLGILAKLQSPLFHLAIGYGFMHLFKWSLVVYLGYAGYGLLNATVNWICEGYGRIRTVFFVTLLLFTAYILLRKRCFGPSTGLSSRPSSEL